MLYSCTCDKDKVVGTSSIIPAPKQQEVTEGYFAINAKTKIAIEDDTQKPTAEYLQSLIKNVSGWDIAITNKPGKNVISFAAKQGLADEAYELDVTTKQINIKAATPKGYFYAIQSIRQLLPPSFESKQVVEQKEWLVKACSIQDEPRFKWRGFMLDVSRHFFPKSYILNLIDYLALHKINTLHMHLMDDQGWRIEIKKYPKLTEVAAWRVDHEDKHWNARPKQKEGEKATYGGFYSQEDIKEIVAYANSHNINVVPEVEMPAHITCALAAYPEFSCTGKPLTVPSGGLWPITDIYCAGNDKTFEFLEDVLSEVMDLFPSKYIHIGGDEATKTEWKKCPKCKARMRKEGLKNVEELQSYFIKRIEKFINKKGRVLIGWDEILEGGLAPQATVMSWRGFKGGIEAAESGHDVVMTPTGHCYFDYYQGPQDVEPLAFNAFLPLNRVYSFDPVPKELEPEAAKHIIGGQANLWTEYVPTVEHAQYMTFPRIAALAEAVWTPKEKKSWDKFSAKIQEQLDRYDFMGINYAKSAYLVTAKATIDKENKSLAVTLNNEISGTEIRYTLDGTEPVAASTLYETPILLKSTTTVNAAAFRNGQRVGAVLTKEFKIHKATVKPVTYINGPSEKYTGCGDATMVNCIRGSANHGDGEWQAWNGDNMEMIIDLEEATDINKISVGTIQNTGPWIFMPKSVDYFISNDGKKFEKVGTYKNTIPAMKSDVMLKDFTLENINKKARYVKVLVHNIGKIPEGHSAAGSPAWMFIDEVVVE
ncbi:beta-N-acetylhexosaminidase [Puteibacter caeruleilacunae]|nr:beta-N-acetylhexosaminidase [Puteibacter caeruleilacunae]